MIEDLMINFKYPQQETRYSLPIRLCSIKVVLSSLMLTSIISCGASGGSSNENSANSSFDQTVIIKPAATSSNEHLDRVITTTGKIKINQVGYLLAGEKIAIVPANSTDIFDLIDITNNRIVYTATLSAKGSWSLAEQQDVKQANFSEFKTPGTYKVVVEGVEHSEPFLVSDDSYTSLLLAGIKSYYFQRSGTDLNSRFAGQWQRQAGHFDEQVAIHASAQNNESAQESNVTITSNKGWYDAGDFGKYTVNSGIATYTLMAAYQDFNGLFDDLSLNIPESTNNTPDILDEIKWNIDWLSTMQAKDGGVYHKLTTLEWPGKIMPSEDNETRYVIGKSTAAAYNFAAVLAKASRLYGEFGSEYQVEANNWLNQAKLAWQWAIANPEKYYQQPEDVKSGIYGDKQLSDEAAWAAAELFLASENNAYLASFNQFNEEVSTPSWRQVSALAFVSLSKHGRKLLTENLLTEIDQQIIELADSYVQQYQSSIYKVPMIAEDFVWGSNAVVANKSLILEQAYRLSGNVKYKAVTNNVLSYLLGVNPTDFSYVTGYGHKTPLNIHHRASQADNIDEPIPGFLVGGAHNGKQDNCAYSSNMPASTYLDDWCSYSTNEVAINWNAAFVYLVAANIDD